MSEFDFKAASADLVRVTDRLKVLEKELAEVYGLTEPRHELCERNASGSLEDTPKVKEWKELHTQYLAILNKMYFE